MCPVVDWEERCIPCACIPRHLTACDLVRVYKARSKENKVEVRVPWRLQPVMMIIDLYFLLREPLFLYHVGYILFAWLGATYSKFFFCFHLMDIVYRQETLRNVLKSVTRNGHQLLMTAVLLAFLVYIYAVLGFIFFRQSFAVSSTASPLRLLQKLYVRLPPVPRAEFVGPHRVPLRHAVAVFLLRPRRRRSGGRFGSRANGGALQAYGTLLCASGV